MKKFYIGTETAEGLYVFGEDNKFYNVDFPTVELNKSMLYTFTEDEAEEVIDGLFNFDYSSLDIAFDIIPEEDFLYLN
jgi:hypothetical protein